MAVLISGKLIGPNGDPRPGVTIMLTAVKTSSAVVHLAPSSSTTGVDGSYSLSVEVGTHNVMIEAYGRPFEKVGQITVYSDSKPGTLNDFLTTPGADELTPAIVAMVDDMRAAAAAYAEIASDAATRAKGSADNAQNIADANTYYVTSEDPDGTIAGLAGTPDGKMFRVALKDEAGQTVIFNYYKNNGGIANFINAESSKRHLDMVLEEIIDLVGFSQLVGFDSLTGSNYIRKADGVRVPSTYWRNSTYISVKAGNKINLTASNDRSDFANIAFYDASKAFISADNVGIGSTVNTRIFTVPADGFIIVATRVVTMNEFECELVKLVITGDNLNQKGSAAAFETVLAASIKGEVVNATPQTKIGAVELGYIDNAGVLVDSVQRHRSLALNPGETAFFYGYSESFQNLPFDEISAVIFKPDAGDAIIVQGLPRTLAGSCWYSGKFEATQSGTLSINLMADPNNASEPYGYLMAGVVSETIIHHPKNIDDTDVDTQVLSVVMSQRDQECLVANGDAVDVTASAEVLMSKILYSNGAYQDVTRSSGAKQWCTKYVPVRKGDKIRYYGMFNTSAASIISYISQLDGQKNYVQELLANAPTAGYQTVGVTAVQDGYIAIRVRLVNTDGSQLTHTISRIGPKYFDGGSGPVVVSGEGAICTPSMEKLPIKLDTTWLYNSPSYQQNGIVSAGDFQYVVCIAEGRKPHILQRSIFGGPWTRFDLSTIPGNPFASPNAQDGHNSFSIAVTKNGYILVTGNHHVNNCRCVISNNPHDITAWTAISYTVDTVTYPRFLQYPDGTLQVFWRRGSSGDGTYYVNTFNDSTKQFGTEALLISAPDGGNPYEQTICVDNAGVLHVCWGYRVDSSSADSNSGMYYAKSSDKGQTFKNALGTVTYALPLHSGNSERPVVVNQGSGYVNQNGACVDLNGRFHTVYWQLDENGYTQIIHLWFDGAAWKTEKASKFTYTEVTSGALLNGTSSRPQICCTRYGKIYVIYRTTEDGRAGMVRAIDVTTPGAPVDYLLARFDANKTELSVNVWEVLRTGVLAMMLYTGINRTASNPKGKFLSENAWLFQAQLP